jgi:hypothetical protein
MLTVALTLLGFGGLLSAGLTDAGSTDRLRGLGLVLLPTAILASLLVVYFDWRRRLMRAVRAEHESRRTP